MKKIVFLFTLSSLLNTHNYSKSVYPDTSRLKQKIEKNEAQAQKPDAALKPEALNSQNYISIEQKLKTLYWAHQNKLIDELRAFDYQASNKALKYLKKNISKHLEKHQKSLVEFAEEIEAEAAIIETCLHELDLLLNKKNNNQDLFTPLKELKQQGLVLKQNLLDLTTIVNALLITRF